MTKRHPKWTQLVRPETANIIIGKRGAGKSGIAYYLQEECSREFGLIPAVCNFPPGKEHLLPKECRVIDFNDLDTADNSVIIIDEGTTQIPAGQRKLEEFVKGCQALCRQRNQIILLIFHASSDVGSRILRGIDTIIVKYPSHRQVQWGSKDPYSKGLLEEARSRIPRVRGKNGLVEPDRHYALVDCESPEYRGMMVNGLPSYWSDALSRAWSGARMGVAICPRCGKSVDSLVSGVCQNCYVNGLSQEEVNKTERRIAKRMMRQGKAPLSALGDIDIRQDTIG